MISIFLHKFSKYKLDEINILKFLLTWEDNNEMKQNAKSDKTFTLNSHVLERVNKWEALVSNQKQKCVYFTVIDKFFIK